MTSLSKDKLTPWFPPEIKPVRNGKYENRLDSHSGIAHSAYWDGDMWRRYKDGPSMVFQNRRWRGLAEKPRKK